jgi:hypothetical protein
MTNKQKPILLAGLIIIVLLLFISPLSIYSGSDFFVPQKQQQAMAQKYSAFSQIQNNMTNKASVENAETLFNKGLSLSLSHTIDFIGLMPYIMNLYNPLFCCR